MKALLFMRERERERDSYYKDRWHFEAFRYII
jgi:hypothetical protein